MEHTRVCWWLLTLPLVCAGGDQRNEHASETQFKNLKSSLIGSFLQVDTLCNLDCVDEIRFFRSFCMQRVHFWAQHMTAVMMMMMWMLTGERKDREVIP